MAGNDVEYLLLAGILPDVTTRMEKAQLKLVSENNFSNRHAAMLWKILSEYYDDHMAVAPKWVVKDRAERSGSDPAMVVALLQLYDGLSSIEVTEHEFVESVDSLKEEELTQRTAEAIVAAREILTGEHYDERGERSLVGQVAAREFLVDALQELEVSGGEAAPEGDMADDMEKIWKVYEQREANPEELGGVKYGIKEVDECTGGVRAGELALIAGFSGTGKSHVLANFAWNSMLSGKNTILFTTETTREEMEIRILARHSRLPEFRLPGGLNSHDLLSGTLSAEHKEVFREVLTDFKSRDTGRLFVVQMPPSGSVDYVYAKAAQYNRKSPIDLILIDSINLLRLSRRYDSKREMLEDMLQGFKRFASSFDNGRGVAIVSPWQMSRTAWKEATEAGGTYTLASLSDTSEAEKALTLDSTVLTPTGWKTMGEMEKGMMLVDPLGSMQLVVDITDHGKRNLYGIYTADGGYVECSAGHIWTIVVDGEMRDVTTLEAKDLLRGEPDGLLLPDIDPVMFDVETWSESSASYLPISFMVSSLLNEFPNPGVLTFNTDQYSLIMDYFDAPPARGYIDSEEYDSVEFEYNAAQLETSAVRGCISQAGLLSGDRTKFRIPEFYMTMPLQLRKMFLAHMAGMVGSEIGDVSTLTVEVMEEVIKHLPLNHPGFGEQLKDMVYSIGMTLDGGPRRIVKIKDLDSLEDVRCISVSKDHGLFLTNNLIPTHNSASQIVSLFKQEMNGTTKLNIQVLKNRSGQEMGKVTYPVDFKNSYIGESGEAPSAPAVKMSSGGMNFRSMMTGE